MQQITHIYVRTVTNKNRKNTSLKKLWNYYKKIKTNKGVKAILCKYLSYNLQGQVSWT